MQTLLLFMAVMRLTVNMMASAGAFQIVRLLRNDKTERGRHLLLVFAGAGTYHFVAAIIYVLVQSGVLQRGGWTSVAYALTDLTASLPILYFSYHILFSKGADN